MLGSMFHANKNKQLFSIFVILSIGISMLCIHVTLATARNEYESSLNINYLSSIAISLKNEKTELNIDKTLQDSYKDELLNVLFLTKTEDGTTLIGWYGYKQTSWFPHMEGRFFSYDEYKKKKNVVYVDDEEYVSLSEKEQKEIKIDGVNYEIIGSGSIGSFNLRAAISPESDQTILQSENENDYLFRIIPSSVFVEKYSPELVFVQFNNPSYKELEEKCNELETLFPHATVTMPKDNSDSFLLIEKLKRSSAGIFLAICVTISTIGIMMEWVSMSKNTIYTYLLCGASKKKVAFSIYAEWIFYYILALFFALILQKILSKFLSMIGAQFLPDWQDLVIEFILFSILTWAATRKKMKKSLELGLG